MRTKWQISLHLITPLKRRFTNCSAKILDLEDRSRSNNIRLRGVPETEAPDHLNHFLTDLLALTLPHRSAQDLIIDRIYRLPKQRHLPSQIPRDTIHLYPVKEEFLKALRSQPNLLEMFRNLSIYPDLSAVTMLKRKEFSQYTKILRDSRISYKWGLPVKLVIFKDNSEVVCPDPATAKDALTAWNLLPTQDASPKRQLPPRPKMVTPLWSEKHRCTASRLQI